MKRILSLFAVAGLLAAPLVPAMASTRSDIDTNERNEVSDEGLVTLSSTRRNADSFTFDDVDLDARDEGDYALFIAFTRAEDPHSNLSNGVENIAGLPYLYAYVLDEDGGVLEYVGDDSMRHRASAGTAWRVTYGVERVPDGAEGIRFFLKQGSRNGVEADGRSAFFYDTGLYLVDNMSDAADVVDAYQDALDEIADDLGGRATRVLYDYDDDEDRDYATGTLLKCPGEPEVYSVTSADTLKRFPDEDTFYAWGHSFGDVRTISCGRIDDYRVSGTWTYERAEYLVKFRGQPAVFTLDNDQYLRLIPNEATARAMYGSRWTSRIREESASNMGDYSYAVPHRATR